MPSFLRSGAKSRLVLAIALATGAAVGVSAPAYAKKQEQPAKAKANYSKEFRAAYKPEIEAAVEAKNYAALQPAIDGLIAAAKTPDDKHEAGRLAYLTGDNLKNDSLKKRGMELMLASGAADAALVIQLHSELSGMALAANAVAEAQGHAAQMIAKGAVVDGNLQVARIAFAQNQHAAGLAALEAAIAAHAAAGQPIPESWYVNGYRNAIAGNLAPQAIKFATAYAKAYPSASSWADAIAVQRNMADYGAQESLDLLRLGQRVGALKNGRDYSDYIKAIDARRLPGEADRALRAATAAGALTASDPFVVEVQEAVTQRLATDLAGLSDQAREARGAGATAVSVMAMGDTYLSHGKPAEAEEFYTLALTKPGVDTPRALTRLGIAQLDQGKTAEAQATFARVEGARQAIAALWAIHAAQAVKAAN